MSEHLGIRLRDPGGVVGARLLPSVCAGDPPPPTGLAGGETVQAWPVPLSVQSLCCGRLVRLKICSGPRVPPRTSWLWSGPETNSRSSALSSKRLIPRVQPGPSHGPLLGVTSTEVAVPQSSGSRLAVPKGHHPSEHCSRTERWDALALKWQEGEKENDALT